MSLLGCTMLLYIPLEGYNSDANSNENPSEWGNQDLNKREIHNHDSFPKKVGL